MIKSLFFFIAVSCAFFVFAEEVQIGFMDNAPIVQRQLAISDKAQVKSNIINSQKVDGPINFEIISSSSIGSSVVTNHSSSFIFSELKSKLIESGENTEKGNAIDPRIEAWRNSYIRDKS